MQIDLEAQDQPQSPHSSNPPLAPPDVPAIAPCPVCGFPMNAIRGSRDAICANCGFKDSCCF